MELSIPKSAWQHYKETKDPPHVHPMGEPEFILHSAPVDGLRIPQSDSRSQSANIIDAALNTYYHPRF